MVKLDAMSPAPLPKQFQFVAGDLCLDFCNTVGGKRGVRARENLHRYEDFLSWATQAGLVKKPHEADLSRKASRQPDEAASVLRRAIALREAIYRIFLGLAQDKNPNPADLRRLNSELAATLGRLRIAPAETGFAWQWANDQGTLDSPLGPIARSAAELLIQTELSAHVSQCHGDTCGWLFLDSSK